MYVTHESSTKFLPMSLDCNYFPFHLGARRECGFIICLSDASQHGVSS